MLPGLTGRTRSAVAVGLFLLAGWAASAAAQTFTSFTIPSPVISLPSGITSGPDGALWFTDGGNNAIWRVRVSGSFASFSILTNPASPTGIVRGTDGGAWFAVIRW